MYKFLLMFLIPSLLKADVVSNMTQEDMWDTANFVGVVSIMKAEYIPNYGYTFEAIVESTLKGNSADIVIIQAPTLHGSVPNHVGDMYLVYLNKSTSESATLIVQLASVVKLFRYPLKDKEMIDLATLTRTLNFI